MANPDAEADTDYHTSVANPALIEKRRALIVKGAIKLFSENGYYKTTIQHIASEVNFSQGFIYQYFKDKDELLFFALQVVLRRYLEYIPAQVSTTRHPIDKLCATITAFCHVIDDNLEATVLAYRSTKSLPPERRSVIQDLEVETNQFFMSPLSDAIDSGLMIEANRDLMVYQFVYFCHGWALKSWHHRKLYTLDTYIRDGLDILVRPNLTPTGREYWDKYFA